MGLPLGVGLLLVSRVRSEEERLNEKQKRGHLNWNPLTPLTIRPSEAAA